MFIETGEITKLHQTIRSHVSEPARLEQLAEEATELAHAALKLARAERWENPTSVPIQNLRRSLVEECTDVLLCMDTLRISGDAHLALMKMERWVNRLEKGDA